MSEPYPPAFKTISAHHEEAMDACDLAEAAIRRGEPDEARRCFGLAYASERLAADLLADLIDLEPTRAVIHRGAGWLAIRAGLFAEAVEMGNRGLAGNPHPEMRAELEEMLAVAKAG